MAPDDEAPLSPQDIRPSIEEALHESSTAVEGDPYGELMATYVELGRLLDSGRVDGGFVDEGRALVDRLVVLGKANEQHLYQKWVAWVAENTTFGGDSW